MTKQEATSFSLESSMEFLNGKNHFEKTKDEFLISITFLTFGHARVPLRWNLIERIFNVKTLFENAIFDVSTYYPLRSHNP